MMRVFISYARADLQRIQPVLSILREHGFELWIDEEGIEGASFWRKEIVEAIENCSAILFFATDASCRSDAVSRELALANEENKIILPVLLETIKVPSDLRYQIAGVQHINLGQDWDRGVKSIIISLTRITGINSDKDFNFTKEVEKKDKFSLSRKIPNRIFILIAILLFTPLGYLYFTNKTNYISLKHALSSTEKDEDKGSYIGKVPLDVKNDLSIDRDMTSSSNRDLSLKGLVIGNSKYKETRLQNPVNDAKDMTDLLKSFGFTITELIDMPRDILMHNIENHYMSVLSSRELSRSFSIMDRNEDQDIVHILYYSGHALELDGSQYIAPIDIDIDIDNITDLKSRLIPISKITPDAHKISLENRFILYAAKPGGIAIDGDRTNSPFTKALIEGLNKRDLDLSSVFTYVCHSVKESTDGRQVPWFSVSAEQQLWMGRLKQMPIKGGASIIVLDGCRDNPFR